MRAYHDFELNWQIRKRVGADNLLTDCLQDLVNDVSTGYVQPGYSLKRSYCIERLLDRAMVLDIVQALLDNTKH
jgi:hypothetical protein